MILERISNAKNFAEIIIKNPVVLSKKKYLFIFSHMRSRSTLLSHILGSHEELSGYSESHQIYITNRDFTKLNYHVYKTNQNSIGGRYIVDKILHNKPISYSVFSNPNLSIICMLREPKDTFRSILGMGKILRSKPEFEPEFDEKYNDLVWIEKYYLDRLENIKYYASVFKGDLLYIDSDDIVNKTNESLERIALFLDLKIPLKANYSIFEQTGKPHFGDMSDLIRTGRIVSENKVKNDEDFDIDSIILERVQEQYIQCRHYLINRSMT